MASTREQASKVLLQLQSPAQKELLNAIDQLRHESIDRDLSIPQIVVCGDESSGKSSLLEAIAQIPFPIGAGMTTTFATELILRNGPQTRIQISIEPSSKRTDEEISHLRQFSADASVVNESDLPTLLEEVTSHLKAKNEGCEFWYDKVKVEITGPIQPHLTLVDLPGLIQSNAGHKNGDIDKTRIKALVKDYIQSPRTIVLAVVSSTVTRNSQEILGLVTDDPDICSRTLGVITKPDLVPSLDEIKQTIELASNKEISLGLGWHVVKNLIHDKKDRSTTVRDKEELELLGSGHWRDLDQENVGIENLRGKLAKYLLDCIKSEIPNLLVEMRDRLNIRLVSLREMGPARRTAVDHRRYLVDIADRLGRLINTSLEGRYATSEHADFFDADLSKRLRKITTDICRDYARRMRYFGHSYHIWEEGVNNADDNFSTVSHATFISPKNTSSHYLLEIDELLPVNISMHEYLRDLASYMEDNRGRDLLNLVTNDTIHAIIRQQTQHWSALTHDCVDQCYSAALEFLREAVRYVADRNADNLWNECIGPDMVIISEGLKEKVEELLWPHIRSHPMTYNEDFETAAQLYGSQDNGTIIPWAAHCFERGLDQNTAKAAEALRYARAYYEVAMSTLVENVPALAVERCLLSKLLQLITPNKVLEMNETKLEVLGAEFKEDREEREKCVRQVKVLETVITVCKRHKSPRSVETLSFRNSGIDPPASATGLPSRPKNTGPTGSGQQSSKHPATGASTTKRPSGSKGKDSPSKGEASSKYSAPESPTGSDTDADSNADL